MTATRADDEPVIFHLFFSPYFFRGPINTLEREKRSRTSLLAGAATHHNAYVLYMEKYLQEGGLMRSQFGAIMSSKYFPALCAEHSVFAS